MLIKKCTLINKYYSPEIDANLPFECSMKKAKGYCSIKAAITHSEIIRNTARKTITAIYNNVIEAFQCRVTYTTK